MTDAWLRRREAGSLFAMRLLMEIALRCGRRVSRVILLPVSAYFLLRRAPERRASRAYLARILGRRPTWTEVARHFHVFAGVTLDRVFLLRRKLDAVDLRIHGLEQLHEAMNLGRGVLMVGAHIGSFDALRSASLQRPDVMVRVVLDAEHSPALSRLVRELNPEIAANIIDPRQGGTAVVLEIAAALRQGAIVAMLGDRGRHGSAATTVDFLGASATFPTAPWLIAAACRAPVVLCLGIYRGKARYDLHFELLQPELRIDRSRRQEQLRAVVQQFAERLEAHLCSAPYNWFNFYDFWERGTDAAQPTQVRPVAGDTADATPRRGGADVATTTADGTG